MRTLVLLSVMLATIASAEARVVRFRGLPGANAVLGRAATASSPDARAAGRLPFEVTPNEICSQSYVLEFAALEGVQKIPPNADYCELPATSLPKEVVATLARVRAVNERVAEALGRRPDELFGAGVRLHVGEHPTGPLASVTSRVGDGFDNVEIDVFKDFRADRFPDRIYAHELAHLLVVEGRLGGHARDIEQNYLFIETFPDLVASYALKTARVEFVDPTVRASLRFGRDGTPLRTMNRPFREFYLGRFQNDPIQACAKIAAKKMTANEKALCKFFRTDLQEVQAREGFYKNAKDKPPTAKQLAATFKPESCMIRYKDGTLGLDACFRSALAPVLVSFVRSIESALGDRPLVALLAAIDAAGREMEHYTCAFTGASARAARTSPSTVSFASVMRAMKALRDGLDERGRAVFDRAWAKHGLDKWARLERFERETIIAEFAYLMLAEANPAFAAENRCDARVPSARGPKCASECKYLPASEPVPGLGERAGAVTSG